MSLDFDTGLALIKKAQEKEREERWFQQWVVQIPYMGKEDYISFRDYCDRLSGANIDKRPTAEIMAELDEVEKQFEKGGGVNGT